MSDITSSSASAPRRSSLLVQDERTKRRNASEARFRFVGLIAVAIGVLALVGLLTSILANGLSSFQQTYAEVEVYLDPAKLDKSGDRNLEKIAKVSTFGYAPLIQVAMETASAQRSGCHDFQRSACNTAQLCLGKPRDDRRDGDLQPVGKRTN